MAVVSEEDHVMVDSAKFSDDPSKLEASKVYDSSNLEASNPTAIVDKPPNGGYGWVIVFLVFVRKSSLALAMC